MQSANGVLHKGTLTITCYKCTRQSYFGGVDHKAAEMAACRAGWVNDQRGDICPTCPAPRAA